MQGQNKTVREDRTYLQLWSPGVTQLHEQRAVRLGETQKIIILAMIARVAEKEDCLRV